MTLHLKWNVRARESDSQPREYSVKKNSKNLLSSSWEEAGGPAFYKAWVSGKPQ